MKTFACCAALAILALAAAPASAADIVAYATDFDSAPVAAPGVTLDISGPGYQVGPLTNAIGGWSGDFHFNISTLAGSTFTFSNLPTHSAASIDFLLGFINEWDSLDGTAGQAPDYLEITIDGALAASLTYNNGSGTVKNVGGGTVICEYCSDPFFSQFTLVDMSSASFLSFAHSAPTLTLGIRALGAGWDGGSSESWGLDSLSLSLSPTPEPATWAMMLLGFGAAGAMLRRRGPGFA